MKENLERGFKGIWIPAEVWLTDKLSVFEKVFLAEIDSLDNKEGCFASNKYLADFFQISETRISKIISTLVSKGFLTRELKKKITGTTRILRADFKKIALETQNTHSSKTTSAHSSKTTSAHSSDVTSAHSSETTSIYNSNYYNKEKDNTSLSEEVEAASENDLSEKKNSEKEFGEFNLKNFSGSAAAILDFFEKISKRKVRDKQANADKYIKPYLKRGGTVEGALEALWVCQHNNFCVGNNDRGWKYTLEYVFRKGKVDDIL
jgi:hypothetical protein